MKTDSRPNVIFIVVDDCGYADLSCSGQTDYRTPEIDRMAAEGTRFTQGYANAPLCTNTRVALMTGRYQYRLPLGLVEPLRHSQRGDEALGIPRNFPTLPLLMKESGYRTALIGKWHLGYLPHFGPLHSGYEEFFGVMGGYTGYFEHIGDGGTRDLYEGETPVERIGYVTDMLSDRARQFVIDHAQGAKPFFLSLHYTAPHWPWSAPSVEAQARVRERDIAQHAQGGSLRIYKEMMEILDRGIGRVMKAVRNHAGDRETFVVFTSDNGGERYSKNWPFVGRKWDLLDGGLRVPQIVWWPGRIRAACVSDQVAATMDLTATCLAAANVAASPDYPLDGQNLLPVLEGRVPEFERTLFWRMANRSQRAVRRGNWKYLKVSEKEFLFDLDYDARERTNFAANQPDRLAAMRTAWEAWDKSMLPIPMDLPSPMVALSEMLW
ncbi:sulfatase-like hydrolase/transferase [Bradyrhizobium liaoningense]|uniref:sulfatase family protein n=1 Tax=Bradyrhizobium liaoningense TaxID=43992 RepID=UPI001BA93771|nr:sulfatase-like hydrolase/transferase [Bradyrhizobium liaoningense]MBR0839465.1 sulfatase-like hydrolase/transferase [Bradyrhizobium liaoningense]